MNHKKAKRKADDVRRKDMKHMAEDAPDSNAVKWFRRPAYQAGKLLQEQGKQMEHKTAAEYLAEKYDTKERVSTGGQEDAEKVRME